MKIAVLKEKTAGEKRVAITPETVKKYIELGMKICIEKGAGLPASISDEEYINAGAKISSIFLELLGDADIVIKVRSDKSSIDEEAKYLRPESLVISLLDPYNNLEVIKQYQKANITSFALELIPRITRAQSMDVLSSQSNLAGYRAVIEAIYHLDKVLPMLMTAAGTISPAKFLIIGAGVAGLQAIATSKRLGAKVFSFDVRKAAKEQVESLGAKFIEVEDDGATENDGVYAKEVSESYKKRQEEALAKIIKEIDVVITTAMIPGKRAPVIINDEMLKSMKVGSIIIDLAAPTGGNSSQTKLNETVKYHNVKIISDGNILSNIASDSSKLFAKNIFNFISAIYNKESKIINMDFEDQVINETLVTYKGKIMKSSFLGDKNE